MNNFWDERFASEEYVYGVEPNVYLKQAMDKYLTGGKMLFPGEGEGRNAVYAARKGFEVVACDQSIEGKRKTEKLAEQAGVTVDYHVGNLLDMDCKGAPFDAVALIYTHFPEEVRKQIHQKIAGLVVEGGLIVMEVFSKKQIENQKANPASGGPRNIDMLYNKEIILNDFDEFEPLEINETETFLKEGIGHNGMASVIRFVGRKKIMND